MFKISADTKRRIAEQWREAMVETYPGQSAASLSGEPDPFRNPIGHALREATPILCEELFGAMDEARIAPALDSLVRIRAVQDFSPRQAVGIVFALKKIVRAEFSQTPGKLTEIEDRIDSLALTAFEIYAQCREQIFEVRVSEAKRKVGFLEKMYSGVEGR